MELLAVNTRFILNCIRSAAAVSVCVMLACVCTRVHVCVSVHVSVYTCSAESVLRLL